MKYYFSVNIKFGLSLKVVVKIDHYKKNFLISLTFVTAFSTPLLTNTINYLTTFLVNEGFKDQIYKMSSLLGKHSFLLNTSLKEKTEENALLLSFYSQQTVSPLTTLVLVSTHSATSFATLRATTTVGHKSMEMFLSGWKMPKFCWMPLLTSASILPEQLVYC